MIEYETMCDASSSIVRYEIECFVAEVITAERPIVKLSSDESDSHPRHLYDILRHLALGILDVRFWVAFRLA